MSAPSFGERGEAAGAILEAAMISTVAVGFDGTSTAAEALAMAADLARRFDATLVLLSAFHGGDGAPSSQPDEHDWAHNPSARTQQEIERAEAHLRAQGIEAKSLIDEGDPADVLVRLAGECNADVLVIGNKGMKRRVLGSVPNTVTHKADCSVLVVKTT
jgi:nucleotide-binding universal stress UspA family protein